MTRTPKPAVLITGASSGIGRETAKYLVRRGFRVFAAARKKDEGNLILDVTDPASVAAAAATIAAEVGDRGLAGLVNNAGIAVPGPLEFVPIADFERQFDVNVTGQLRVTQAILPLLRLGRGRIVNISSIAGRSAMPVMGPYSASKFALEAMSDSLRLELRPWNIHVALIEPGPIQSEIWAKAGSLEFSCEAEAMYPKLLVTGRKILERAVRTALPAERVSRDIHHALTARWPKARYLIGGGSHLRIALENIPTRLRDWIISRAI